jgi:hypothetical protein
VNPGSTAPIEKIGSRLLQLAELLFHLPLVDAPSRVMRELTTIPSVRFSEILEPFCGGYEADRPGNDQAADRDAPDSPRMASPSITAASGSLPGNALIPETLVNNEENYLRVPRKFTSPSEMLKPPPVFPARIETSPTVAGVFRAMKDLNFLEAGLTDATPATGRAGIRPPNSEALLTPPGVGYDHGLRADRSAEYGRKVPVKETVTDKIEVGLKRPLAASSSIHPAPAVGLRMAYGAPRIAALLQANLASKDKEIAETHRTTENRSVIHSKEKSWRSTPEGDLPGAKCALDIDLLMEKLAQQLEFELLRTYGTSGKF